MRIELTRKAIAEPISLVAAGAVRGFMEASPVMLGMFMTAVMWKSGHKKTAVAYGAMTVGCVARIVHGAESDAETDLAFAEAIQHRIEGPSAEAESAT